MSLSTAEALPKTTTLNLDLNADEIVNELASIKTVFLDSLAELVSNHQNETKSLSFDSTFQVFSEICGEASLRSSQVCLPALVSGSAPAREQAATAKKELRKLFDETFARMDIYSVLKRCSSESLNEEQTYFSKLTLSRFQRKGLDLSVEQQQAVAKLDSQLAELEVAFEQAINEDLTTVPLTEAQLTGLPASFISALPVSEDDETKRLVSMKAPVLVPVMSRAAQRETRRVVEQIAQSRCQANETRLQQLCDLRHERAVLLGFNSHAEYMLEPKMAQTVETVNDFMSSISARLTPRLNNDLTALQQIQLNLPANSNSDSDPELPVKLESYDLAYMTRILKEERHGLDDEKIREFFPLKHVRSAVLNIYQDLLGLRFEKLDFKEAGCWHEDVEAFRVYDKDSQALLGRFYLDLFSRPGKFGHQCVVPLTPSFVRKSGERVNPQCAILGNLTKPTKDRPSCLRFSEVHTFFHE